MRRDELVPVLLAFGLLTGCGAPAGNGGTPTPMPPESAPPVEGEEMICRIVDGAEDGTLLLAEVENGPYDGGGVYSFPVGETPVWIDGARKTAADLTDGMLVTVRWNGMVAESYPAQLGETYSLRAESEDTDDHCGLWLQVLSDLWDALSLIHILVVSAPRCTPPMPPVAKILMPAMWAMIIVVVTVVAPSAF